MKKRTAFILTVCLFLLPFAVLFSGHDNYFAADGNVAVSTFYRSGAKFIRLEVNGWQPVNRNFASKEDALEYFKDITGKILGRDVPFRPEISEKNGSVIIRAQGYPQKGIKARAALQYTINSNAYFILSLSTEDSRVSYRRLEAIYDGLMKNDKNMKNINVTGYFRGDLAPEATDRVIQRMLTEAKARNVEKVKTEKLVSVTAYTPGVSAVLRNGEKQVNINMALRYNAVEDKTFVFVGSPVISIEY